MAPIKVVLVDDHQLFTESLSEMINGFGNYEVVFRAVNGIDLQEKMKNAGELPDIVLLDIGMKEMNGFETAKYLQTNFPQIKVLVLSVYDDERRIVKMIRLGCKGYILKEVRSVELKRALDEVMSKGYFLSGSVTGRMIFSLTQPADEEKLIASLNPREMQFLKLAASELTYKEIAFEMGLSIKTVDHYRDVLFEKLSVKSRIGLVLYAIKNEIVVL